MGWGRDSGGGVRAGSRCGGCVGPVLVVGHRSHRRGGARVAGCGGLATASTRGYAPQCGRGWVSCVVAARACLGARCGLSVRVPRRQPQRATAHAGTVEGDLARRSGWCKERGLVELWCGHGVWLTRECGGGGVV